MSEISTPEVSAPVTEAPAAPAEADVVDVASDVAEGGEAAAAPVEEKQPEPPKKWKVKIDGSEEELDEESLVKAASLGKAAYKRMQEAAELRKNVEQFVDLLRKDPLKVLADPSFGIPREVQKKMAEAIINEELEEMQKTPEQREKERLQKELEDLKAKQKKDEEDRQAREFARIQEQEATKLDSEMTKALESSGLPKTPYTVKKIAEVMYLAMQNNIDVSPSDVIPLIRKQMTEDIRNMFSSTPEDLIEEFLGKDNLSRLRKRNLQKIKQVAETAQQVKPTGNEVKTPSKTEKKISMRDFLKGRY